MILSCIMLRGRSRPLVGLHENQKMRLPFEVVSGIVLLNVSVNGKTGYMAFDTGAMQTCLNKTHFTEIEGKEVEVAKFDNEVKKASTVVTTCDIECNDWSISEASVLLLDMGYVEKPLRGAKPDLDFLGTMGIDLIKSHTVLLDYANLQVVLDEEAPDGLEYYDMKADVLPVIDISCDGVPYRFVLDSGANTCLLDKTLGKEKFKVVNEASGIVQIPSVSALGREYKDIIAVMNNIDAIKAKVDVSGVIGYQVLKDYVSYFDFKNEKLGIR